MQKEMFEIPKEEGLVESCQVNVGTYDGVSEKRSFFLLKSCSLNAP